MIGNNKKKAVPRGSAASLRGFTLIEMLVALSIFAMIILATSSIFRNIVTDQKTTSDDSAIQNDIKYFTEIFSREVKGAVRNTGTADLCGVAPDHIFATNASSSALLFQNSLGECVNYFMAADANNVNRLEINRGSEEFFVSSDQANVANLNFVIDDAADVQPIVTLDIQVLSQADQKVPAYNIQTTISPREIYVAPVATTTPSSTQAFAPSNLSSLALWFKADDSVATTSDNHVNTWLDQSGNGSNLLQSTPANQPLWVDGVLNGKPVLRFDGANTYLDGGSSVGNIQSTGASFFIVGKSNTSQGAFVSKSLYGSAGSRYSILYEAGNGFGFLYTDDGARTMWFPSIFSGQSNLMTVIVNGTSTSPANTVFINSVSKGTTPITSNYSMISPYNFLVGAYNNGSGSIPPVGGYFLDGDIAEIIMYNRPLSDTERQQVETYLNTKYAIY